MKNSKKFQGGGGSREGGVGCTARQNHDLFCINLGKLVYFFIEFNCYQVKEFVESPEHTEAH